MLTPRKRIRKKDLKEDKLVTLYFKSRQWLEENIKYITGGAAALLVVILGLLVISHLRQKADQTASVEFSKASRLFLASDYRNAVVQFTAIVNRSGGTASGKMARFYLAQSLYNTGDYLGAQKQFKKFAASFSADEQLRATALGGEAACLEQQGKPREAAVKYEAIVDKFKDLPRAPYFLLHAARCYELADDAPKSQALFQKIINDFPDSKEKEDAVLLSALK
jgi:TolA-binding protein